MVILKFLKKAYGICMKGVNPLWTEHPFVGGFPDYFYTLEANIESGRIVTKEGSTTETDYLYHHLDIKDMSTDDAFILSQIQQAIDKHTQEEHISDADFDEVLARKKSKKKKILVALIIFLLVFGTLITLYFTGILNFYKH